MACNSLTFTHLPKCSHVNPGEKDKGGCVAGRKLFAGMCYSAGPPHPTSQWEKVEGEAEDSSARGGGSWKSARH